MPLLDRKERIASGAGALLFPAQQSDLANAINWQAEFATYVILFTAIIFILLKFGMVVTVTAVFTINQINGIALGTDWTTWYAPSGFATMALIIGFALWAFWRSAGDRELLNA